MNARRVTQRTVSILGSALAAMSCATPGASAGPLRDRAGAYSVEVLIDGAPAETFFHAGETYVLGQRGRRYTLRVHNNSSRRAEAVVSVDGLDVTDGKPADFAKKRGYLVPAWGVVDIDGWRLSMQEAAAFRFASVSSSYAAQTGNPRNVGVIGVAMFPERFVRPAPRPYFPRRPCAACGGYPEDLGMDAEGHAEPSAAPAPPSATMGSGASAKAGANLAQAESMGRADDAVDRARSSAPGKRERSGLGTEFGEAVASHLEEVEFTRANETQPAWVMGVRYNDHRGLVAVGLDVDGCGVSCDVALRRTASPFPTNTFATPPVGWRRD